MILTVAKKNLLRVIASFLLFSVAIWTGCGESESKVNEPSSSSSTPQSTPPSTPPSNESATDDNQTAGGEVNKSAPVVAKNQMPNDLEEISLDGPCTQAVAGRSGRYLCLEIRSLNRIKIFDVSTSKFVGQIPTDGNKVLLAASHSKLLVLNDVTKELSRWNLDGFSKESSQKIEGKGFTHLAMGAGGDGPALVGTAVRDNYTLFSFYDLETLKPISKPFGATPPQNDSGAVAAAFNGKIFTVFGKSPISVENGQVGKIERNRENFLPSSDDRFFLTPSSAFDMDTGSIPRPGGKLMIRKRAASCDSDYYLYFKNYTYRNGSESKDLQLIVHNFNDVNALFRVPRITIENERINFDRVGQYLLQKVFFVPEANVVVVIPKLADKLIVHKLDISKELENSGIDYFFVATHPPSIVVPGQKYVGSIDVKSTAEEVKFVLRESPKGMSIDKNGKIEWNVPQSNNANIFLVRVQVSTGRGEKLDYSFKLRIQGSPRTVPKQKMSGKGSSSKGSSSKSFK